MPVQTYNPLGFWCAPNAADPSYATCHDFKQFVAYGLVECWLSRDENDPADEVGFPWDREAVGELRDAFLSVLETLVVALWKGDYQPGDGDIDGDWPSVVVGDDVMLWRQARLDEDAILLELIVAGCDITSIWLSYDAILDRREVAVTLKKAHELVGGEVWPALLEAATAEQIALWTLRREEASRLLMDEIFSEENFLPT